VRKSSQRPKQPEPTPHHVSLIALPDAVVSTLFGIFDVMNAFTLMDALKARTGAPSLFQADIVGESVGPVTLASGVPVNVQRAIGSIDATDIVIVPSVLLPAEGWKTGRYPALVDWLNRMHDGGAVICSACSGIFLLAETGLFDGRDATVHFGYAREFTTVYPNVAMHPERTLVITGRRDELVSSGASTTWHDLTLYLIARYAGATTAQEVARMFALQWHQDGLTPYIIFEGRTDHGDAEITASATASPISRGPSSGAR
jgi:transcriptional regulator GlxA family with amidase domain